jgi:hypothetical protein
VKKPIAHAGERTHCSHKPRNKKKQSVKTWCSQEPRDKKQESLSVHQQKVNMHHRFKVCEVFVAMQSFQKCKIFNKIGVTNVAEE